MRFSSINVWGTCYITQSHYRSLLSIRLEGTRTLYFCISISIIVFLPTIIARPRNFTHCIMLFIFDLTLHIVECDSMLQGYVICPAERRFQLLFTFLKKNKNKKIMVSVAMGITYRRHFVSALYNLTSVCYCALHCASEEHALMLRLYPFFRYFSLHVVLSSSILSY